jgi:hypothetical protein
MMSVIVASVMLMGGICPSVRAEVGVAVEFRTPLESHGHWTRNDRWGDVWIPAHIEKDWAPYTRGHWVYTDDWGWYWVSDESEADWGWAVYHYGRWFFDPAEGWVWIPGREWAPAWVSWRRGAHRIGWAPQPPDEIFVEIRDNPHYWVFVEPSNFVSERVWVNIEPGWHQTALLQDTVIVNRTVVIRERSFAVNPGIEPAVIAHEVGRPIPAYQVSPVVLAGTADIEGAIKVRPEEAPARAKQQRVEQTNVIEPAKTVEAPQALAPDENGRLGERPPQAAKAEKEEPGKPKAAEETKPGEKGKTVKQGGPEEKPGKPKAAEEAKPGEKGKTVEQGGPEEKPGKPKAAEETKPGEKGKTVEQGGPEEKPGKPKAAEEAKPGEKGKTVEQGRPEEKPGKPKAAEETKPGEKGKTVEQGGPEEKPGKPKAAEGTKPEKKGKTVEGGSEEKPGQKTEQQGKPKQSKKTGKEGEPEQPL